MPEREAAVNSWPDRRVLDLFHIGLPVLQAPMAGYSTAAMAAAVSEAGGLGALPCALLDAGQIRAEFASIRARTSRPLNLNFFCHRPPQLQPEREAAWRRRLAAYYAELGLDPAAAGRSTRTAFDAALCDLVIELKPEVVSFHFGLPDPGLVQRLKAAGRLLISSATTVHEARWLEDQGCDAIIAQGYEAGGHRGMFLSGDPAAQAGTMALTPQIADEVKVPVIAAGGIADGRGIAAAFALGAAAVLVGTAYLLCPEANLSAPHLRALRAARDRATTLTNVFTGRLARGFVNRLVREVGPVSAEAPEFPLASGAVAPLRAAAEAAGSDDFSPMWSGQAAALSRELPAGELTRRLAAEAVAALGRLRPLSPTPAGAQLPNSIP